jgi:hypothetical protein
MLARENWMMPQIAADDARNDGTSNASHLHTHQLSPRFPRLQI